MNRPHVLVNVAMTADGKIDSIARKGATISSEADKRRVDELRASVDAVLVGGRTLLDEDPRLTVKSADLRAERVRRGLPENPVKVGIASEIPDTGGRGVFPGGDGGNRPLLLNFLTTGPARRLIYTTTRTAPEQVAHLKEAGAEIFVQDGARVDLHASLESLYNLGIQRLVVEGGGTLIADFFRLLLVDELTIYIAPKIFAGASAPTLADGLGFLPDQSPRLRLVSVGKFDREGGILLRYQVDKTFSLAN